MDFALYKQSGTLALSARSVSRCQARQARVRVHVLVTSYECVLAELSELKRLEWEVLIVDEGHRLKNRESRLSQVTCLSRLPARASVCAHQLKHAQGASAHMEGIASHAGI